MNAPLFREALLEAQADVSAGIVSLSFASEKPVLRNGPTGKYWEVLSHGPGDANLGLLNTEGVVLADHKEGVEIGTVQRGSARVEADRKTRARIVITDRVWRQRIQAGERPAVSVGYRYIQCLRQEPGEGGIPLKRFSWAPFEVSLLTTAPADDTVGIFRSNNMNTTLDKLLAMALSGTRQTEDTFTRGALVRDFSLQRIISHAPLTDFEQEVQNSCRGLGGQCLDGRFVRFESLLPLRRDMQATVSGAGAEFVQPDMGPAVELLHNHVAGIPLGARTITGLSGNFVYPTIKSGAQPESLEEISAAHLQDLALDGYGLKPCRVTVAIPISKQLLIQSSNAAEDAIRAEIRAAIGVKVDRMILNGKGAENEPLGIMQTPGISSVIFGGAPTLANVLAFEKSLADKNADQSASLGWCVSPTTRNLWKQTPKIAGYPKYLMGEDGLVNGYRSIATNQVADTHRAIFGNWSDCHLLIWGNGIDFVADHVTMAEKGAVRLVAHLWFNVLLRHPESFCVSADSAAQE